MLENLSRYLEQVPADTRDVSIAMMGNFAKHPLGHERTGALLTTLLHWPVLKPEPKAEVKHLRMVKAGGWV